LLREKCAATEEVLEATWACRDVVALVKYVSFPKWSREKMNNTSLWKKIRDDIFDKIANNRASSGSYIPQSSAKYCLVRETLIQEQYKTFGGVKSSPI
jgi:hypothetical protein